MFLGNYAQNYDYLLDGEPINLQGVENINVNMPVGGKAELTITRRLNSVDIIQQSANIHTKTSS